MYQKERLDWIMGILNEYGYVTVKYLTQELHYSTATINRDLNLLEKQKLIKRSYGGVERVKEKGVPLNFRYHKMKPVKNKLGKKAAEFINDGDKIFIDASTTTQYIGKYITEKKNLTVITNNMALVSYLSEYGIEVICLGGKVVEIPSLLDGAETVENAMKYSVDKMFFSTGAISSDGKIASGKLYDLLHRVMINNSKEVYCIVDSGKVDRAYNMILCDLAKVDYLITDYVFDDKIKEKYHDTNFVEI